MKVKCPICNGLKSLVSLGCIKKECCNCEGKGYVNADPETEDSPRPIADDGISCPLEELPDGITHADTDSKALTAEALPQKEVVTDIPSEVAMTAGGTQDD